MCVEGYLVALWVEVESVVYGGWLSDSREDENRKAGYWSRGRMSGFTSDSIPQYVPTDPSLARGAQQIELSSDWGHRLRHALLRCGRARARYPGVSLGYQWRKSKRRPLLRWTKAGVLSGGSGSKGRGKGAEPYLCPSSGSQRYMQGAGGFHSKKNRHSHGLVYPWVYCSTSLAGVQVPGVSDPRS